MNKTSPLMNLDEHQRANSKELSVSNKHVMLSKVRLICADSLWLWVDYSLKIGQNFVILYALFDQIIKIFNPCFQWVRYQYLLYLSDKSKNICPWEIAEWKFSQFRELCIWIIKLYNICVKFWITKMCDSSKRLTNQGVCFPIKFLVIREFHVKKMTFLFSELVNAFNCNIRLVLMYVKH